MNNGFKGLSQMAQEWEVDRKTLRTYINRISSNVPLYNSKQRVFAPCQYKKIAELLGFDIK